MDEIEKRRRASFGAGVAQGLRMAGIENPGVLMNEAKLSRMESGLTGIARKVLEAVPIQSAWTKEQIVVELRRQGCGADRHVVDGCLENLRGRGLITEPSRGEFTRITAKARAQQPEIKIVHSISSVAKEPMPEPKQPPAQQTTAPQKADHLLRLAEIANSMRHAAEELEGIAIEFEERIQTAEKDTANLRQLQALLKSIGA